MKLLVLIALVGAACAAALPLEAPEPVMDTEEVVQAKAEFQAAYEAAAAAAEAGETPEVILPEGAPLAVEDTPEVAAAKADFMAAFEAAKANSGALPEVILPEGAPEAIDDTEEVAAAKATFKAAFDAAAAAAEAAPDNDLDGKLSTIDGQLSPFYTNTLPFGAYGIHAPILASPVVTETEEGKPVVAGSPLIYNSLGLPATPLITSPSLIPETKIIQGSTVISGAPLTYSGLGLHGLYGLHGLHGLPLIKIAEPEA